MGILGPPFNQLCDLQQINCLFWALVHSSAKCGQLCLSHPVSGEQNVIKSRWSAEPSGRAWKDSTRALSLVPLPTPSHFSCSWGWDVCFTPRLDLAAFSDASQTGRQYCRVEPAWTECVCAKSLQACLTLCNHMDCSPPDSSLHRILQARILEEVAISPPGDLSDPGIKTTSPALAGGFFTTTPPGKAKVWGRTRSKF